MLSRSILGRSRSKGLLARRSPNRGECAFGFYCWCRRRCHLLVTLLIAEVEVMLMEVGRWEVVD